MDADYKKGTRSYVDVHYLTVSVLMTDVSVKLYEFINIYYKKSLSWYNGLSSGGAGAMAARGQIYMGALLVY